MSDKTRKVGKLFTHQDERGSTYIQIYFVDSSDEVTYTPAYGQDGDQAPFDFPANTYVYDWDKNYAGDHFEITVKCHNDGYNPSSSYSWSSPNRSQRQFRTESIYFDPSWWGVRKATASDAGSKNPDGTTTIDPLLNIEGDAAEVDDWIYREATKDDKKEPNYSKSPFWATFCDEDSMPIEWIGQNIPTIGYVCVFYTNSSIMNFAGWKGVNGSGSSYFSPPSGCVPTGYTSSGQWKSTGTVAIEDAKQFNGVDYHSVTRTMILAPGDLRWDPNKNGGAWSW